MRSTDESVINAKDNAIKSIINLFYEQKNDPNDLLTVLIEIEDCQEIDKINSIVRNFHKNGPDKSKIPNAEELYKLSALTQIKYHRYKEFIFSIQREEALKTFQLVEFSNEFLVASNILEAQEKAEGEAREKADREAREKAERKAEREAREKAQRKAEREAQREARRKAEEIAEKKALRNAKKKEFKAGEREKKATEEKAQEEAKRKLEEEERVAREAKEKVEREAKEKAEKLAEKKLKAEERKRRFLEAQSNKNPKTESEIQNQPDIDKIQEKARKEEQEKAKKQAQEEAKKKAEEQARKEAEEKAKQKAEEQAKIEAEEREKAEKKALKEKIAQERKDRYEKAKTTKSQVIKKGQENFEKFQPFFDFLRSKEYFDIGEIGFFGSRVYKEVLGKALDREITKNPNADFDFYCLPKSADSLGVFRIYQDELGSKINFSSLLTEFNERNPNMQIQLIEDVNAKKSVNYGKGGEKSLNFKLVATFFDDKVVGEKSEKIIKEQIEFDLNFYTQQSALQKLQWQINLERLMLTQGLDRVTDLKVNQSNCESSQYITTEKFIFEALGERGKNFLTQFNPNANKFLDRIVNKKGVYKYLEDQELDEIKAKLVKDHRLALEREFEEYKKFLSINKTLGKNPSIDARITEYGKIIEAVKKDPILKTLEEEISLAPQSPRSANATQVLSNARTR